MDPRLELDLRCHAANSLARAVFVWVLVALAGLAASNLSANSNESRMHPRKRASTFRC